MEAAPTKVLGVAVCGSLASNYERRGLNQCHFAVYDGERTFWRHLGLEKGLRTRLQEDLLCSRFCLHSLALVGFLWKIG